ncbi:MAG: phosphatidate cytidylyltransferase [Solirubrobacteraceae bacterium]
MAPASRSRGRPDRDRPPPRGSRGSTRRRPASSSRSGDERPPRRPSDLLARVLVAVPAAVVAIVFVNLGGTAWALFMIAISWVCLHELYRMLPRWRPAPVVGFAAAAAMVLAARFGSERGVMEVAVAAIPVAFLAVVARGGGGMQTVSIAGTLLGVYWLGLAFAHAVLLRQLDHGNGILIDILVGTFLGDTAAYIGGRLFGRRPLAPAISPKKTWEGLFCGMLIAILSVFIAGLNQTWLTQGDALLLGVTVAVLGPIGDLFESLVKRDAGIKDAGNLFGAHGGALDRLDAVIFTVVAGYYVWVSVPH